MTKIGLEQKQWQKSENKTVFMIAWNFAEMRNVSFHQIRIWNVLEKKAKAKKYYWYIFMFKTIGFDLFDMWHLEYLKAAQINVAK